MSYEVIVVDDNALPCEWAFAENGRGEVFFFVTQTALRQHPSDCLSGAWRAWEDQRLLVAVG